MPLCNERIIGICRRCGTPIKIAWVLAPDYQVPEGHVFDTAGDVWYITAKCIHIGFSSGHYDGLGNLEALLKTILTTKEAAEILGIGLHGVIAAIKRELLLGATKLGTGKRGTWAIPLDAVLKYKAERRSPGRPKKEGATDE